MVESIIRLGYSPYIKSYERKTALMGAVEGGNIETVKLILNFNYVPTDMKFFVKSKNCKDSRGNNVMHIANKNMQKDI